MRVFGRVSFFGKVFLIAHISMMGMVFSHAIAHAQEAEQTQETQQNLGPSGLPLPRFVSTKYSRANVRVGPGKNYSLYFTYQKQGLPVEIIQEYDLWRKIRGSDGDEGWVHRQLLSDKRTAMIAPWQKDKNQLVILRKTPSDDGVFVVKVEPNVIGNIRQCTNGWCELSIGYTRGWIKQDQLWGVYPDEKIKD